MMDSPPALEVLQPVVAATLRGIRQFRGMTIADMAAAMQMPPRSYQHFEAGGGRLNMRQLIRFAEVTDCDFAALLAAILLQTPSLAVQAADNKVVTALVMRLADFSAEQPLEMAKLTAAAVSAAMKEALGPLDEPPP